MKRKNKISGIVCLLLALVVFGTSIFSMVVPIHAAKKEPVYTMKWKTDRENVHIRHGEFGGSFVAVMLPAEGYRVKNITSSSKNCKVKAAINGATYKMDTDGNYSTMTETFELAYCELEIYALKKGTYRIDFDITDKAGKSVKSKTLMVYANRENPFASIAINGDKLETYSALFRTEKKDNMIEVKMAAGYKLLRIRQKYGYPYKVSVVKNGKKFSLKKAGETMYITIYYRDKYTKRTEALDLKLIFSDNQLR